MLEAADSNVSATELEVFAIVPPPHRESQVAHDGDSRQVGAVASSRHELHIDYDARFRVLSHNSPVRGLEVTIAPDSFPNAIRVPSAGQPR